MLRPFLCCCYCGGLRFGQSWCCCCTDDLVPDVAATVVVVVAFANVVFDDNYIVCVADVAVVAGYVVISIVVAVDDAGVLAVAYVDA